MKLKRPEGEGGVDELCVSLGVAVVGVFEFAAVSFAEDLEVRDGVGEEGDVRGGGEEGGGLGLC